MSEQNKALVRRFLLETQNDKNLEVIDELVAADFVGRSAGLQGSANLRKAILENLNSFPDLRVTIEDQIGEEDKVVTRYIARGTHKRRYRGVPPTDQPVEYTVVGIHRISGGKIVEGWRIVDREALLRQLGQSRH